MPERVTKKERMVTLAIEKARKTIETLRESTQVIPVDTEVEVQKIKRPKVQDASKITNQTQEKEGYGLAGESLKKSFGESTLSGPNIREANSLSPRFIGSNSSINLTRKEMNKVFEEFVKKNPKATAFDIAYEKEYIDDFIALATKMFPKNVGRTISNIGESQFKKEDDISDSKEYMIDEIEEKIGRIKSSLDTSVSKETLLKVLTAIEDAEDIIMHHP
jgi:hypothetical protein